MTSGCATENLYTAMVQADFAPLPLGFSDIDDVIVELSRDPKIAAEIARGRQELPALLHGAAIDRSLAGLRLSHGLSQRQLAETAGMQQPHISRVENGEDVYISTLRRVAIGLNEPFERVISAYEVSVRNKK